MNRERILEYFNNYVGSYDISDKRIQLKIEHSYRVSVLCERIARTIGLSESDVDLAWFIGVVHDIGRFEQLRLYNTFRDGESIDHAKLGAEILFGKGYIRNFIEKNDSDEIIEKAIRYHSTYQLPQGLPGKMCLFCNIIRDADKIDILKVSADTPSNILLGCSEQKVKESEISERVIDTFMEHRAIDNQDKHTPADYIVGHISLAFELFYPISRKIMLEQGNINRLLDFQSGNPKAKIQFAQLDRELHLYLKNSLSG